MTWIMANTKTSAAGFGTILLGLGGLFEAYSKGVLDGTTLTMSGGLIISGLQGLFAKDATTHSTVAEVAKSTAKDDPMAAARLESVT